MKPVTRSYWNNCIRYWKNKGKNFKYDKEEDGFFITVGVPKYLSKIAKNNLFYWTKGYYKLNYKHRKMDYYNIRIKPIYIKNFVQELNELKKNESQRKGNV